MALDSPDHLPPCLMSILWVLPAPAGRPLTRGQASNPTTQESQTSRPLLTVALSRLMWSPPVRWLLPVVPEDNMATAPLLLRFSSAYLPQLLLSRARFRDGLPGGSWRHCTLLSSFFPHPTTVLFYCLSIIYSSILMPTKP